MEMKRKQTLKRTLVLMMTLLCLIGLIPAVYVQAIDLNPGPVTVNLVSSQESWADDIEGSGAVMDFYQIAKAQSDDKSVDRFVFVPIGSFSGVDLTKEAEEIAQAAAAVVKAGESPAVSGKKLEESFKLDPGLYLMIVHGTDPSEKSEYFRTGENGLYTIANTVEYEYQFTPQLISIPTKAEGASSNTADQGEWFGVEGKPLNIALKVSREPFGIAKYDPPVKKIVEGPAPKGSIFTFAMTPGQPDAPMPDNSEARRDESTGTLYMDKTDGGEYEFGWMTFTWADVGKTYTYAVAEIPGKDSNFTYDVQIYTMTVVVTGEDRQVQIDVSYKDATGNNVDGVSFTNVYKEMPPPPTGDTMNLNIWILVMLIAAVGMCVVLIVAKRKRT